MEKIYLLDAYALIYRAYYALIRSPRINSKGENTSAVFGFVNTLEDILRKENPDYIAVAFDPSGKTFRHEAYPEYKAQREATPEDIRRSVPIIKEIIQAYRIPIMEVEGFEADDVIGTLATRCAAMGLDVYMFTPDKDYAQLVAPHIHMCRPGTGSQPMTQMGPEEVCAKYGIQSPIQVIDLLALIGDTADNIPGCPGVGEKTAVKIIGDFGSIEGLLEHTDRLKGALKKKVEENAEKIRFSKFLTTIRTDIEMEVDLEAMRRQSPDETELKRIFEQLEFRNLSQRIFPSRKNESAKKQMEPSLFPEFLNEGAEDLFKSNLEDLKSTPHEYHLVDSVMEMEMICRQILTFREVAFDTETTSTDPLQAHLIGFSLSIPGGKAWYIPVPRETEEVLNILNIFKPFFENREILKIGQNLKYDLNVLARYGFDLQPPMFDTMIAHYLIQPELRHNLDYLAEIYLKYQTIHIEDLIGSRGNGQRNMADLAPQEVYEYACEDADVAMRLKPRLEKELKENAAESLFHQIEMPLMPILAKMERNGVCLDAKALAESSEEMRRQMAETENQIYA